MEGFIFDPVSFLLGIAAGIVIVVLMVVILIHLDMKRDKHYD